MKIWTDKNGKEFMKIFREVKGIKEPEEDSSAKAQKEQRIAMKPVKTEEAEVEATEKEKTEEEADALAEKMVEEKTDESVQE